MAAKVIRTAALAGIALLVACGEDESPIRGEMQLNDLFTADFSLTDTKGQPATDERFEGEPMLIYFGFSSCPDVCPAALSVMSASLDALGGDADDIQPLFVTVDPERDTEERLGDYLAFDERILGLTGSPEAVAAAAKSLKVGYTKVPMPDSALGYTMDHSSLFYLTDPAGKPVVALDDTMAPEDIARIVRRQL